MVLGSVQSRFLQYSTFLHVLGSIIAYAYMFKEPFKESLTIIAYVYMFKEPFNRSLINRAYAYMFK